MRCSYIKWTKKAVAAGGHASGLEEIYERCLCDLRCHAQDQYRNDERYLKLWVAYVRLPTPARGP